MLVSVSWVEEVERRVAVEESISSALLKYNYTEVGRWAYRASGPIGRSVLARFALARWCAGERLSRRRWFS
jgi:hypothetical protein